MTQEELLSRYATGKRRHAKKSSIGECDVGSAVETRMRACMTI